MRTYRVRYIVEAGNLNEAKDKFAIGETLEETWDELLDVINRETVTPIKRIK